MIKVLCETMTSSHDSSLRVSVMEYDSLASFKAEVLKHYPKIHISLPEAHENYWFGIQYGDTADGFWFRWLKAIVDTERGCLYSRGDSDCVHSFGLLEGVEHCSKEVYKLLEEIHADVLRRQKNVVYVD